MRKLPHHANAIVFAVLLVSGFLLHLSILRGPLSAYRLMPILDALFGRRAVRFAAARLCLVFVDPDRPVAKTARLPYACAGGIVWAGRFVWQWLDSTAKSHLGSHGHDLFEAHRWLAYLSIPWSGHIWLCRNAAAE